MKFGRLEILVKHRNNFINKKKIDLNIFQNFHALIISNPSGQAVSKVLSLWHLPPYHNGGGEGA